jgi:hypothetical protein
VKAHYWRCAAEAHPTWVAAASTPPKPGVPVWCYWPGRLRDGSEPGMQGVAVLGLRWDERTTGLEPFWHAEDDANDTRFNPTHWMPLPVAPAPGTEGKA